MSVLDLLSHLPDATPEDPMEAAARKLQAAIENYPGRRRSVQSWRKQVGPWLGKKRLAQTIYQQVIDRGVELGLFRIDSDSGSYPFFVVLEASDVSVDPMISEPIESAEVIDDSQDFEDVEPDLPKVGNPPRYMDCGHLSWSSPTGHDADCRKCSRGWFGHPFFMKGNHAKRVVPEWARRIPAKDRGWPGYCSHPETHVYIGGLGNDCRHYNNSNARCTAHQLKTG